ncbi:MAG: NAD-dependent dehydratase [Nitrospiraceae bacterium]|nr:NAD-dependent dehydratase [Nitrospiraceae bacterium]|tara:strand:- start:51 stop:1049 length:999 start_codon:yes stop_codon:yes gene_type:complete
MRTIVTGGAGFIGSHLVERLLALGHEVRVLDNLSTGQFANLAAVSGNSNLVFHQVDLVELESIQGAFKGVDAVFHLGALADIVPSIQSPLAYFHANVHGTGNVLEAARAANVSRLIYVASSSCYGIPDVYPTPESEPVRPQYPYALTKYLGEELVFHWGKVYGLPVVSLRLFNVYGPRARTSGTYGAVFGVFLAQKLAGKPFTVIGDGTQVRDFTYVSDVVEALILASRSEEAVGRVLNVGSGKTYSINQLVTLLDGEVTYIPRRPGEPDCTWADISKIRNTLGWRPQVLFEQGVAQMLANIEYWREAPVWDPESIRVASVDWFKYLGEKHG